MRIVTDSSVDMPEEWKSEYDIDILPININFGDKSYRQGIDISYDDFYSLVGEHKMIPKTSLPTPDQIEQFYARIAKLGETILSIHVSSNLSGTVAQVQMAAMNLKEKYQIVPFDSLSGSAMLAFFCREARLLEKRGLKVDEIVEKLEKIRKRINIIFTIDNLEFARLSGRIGSLQSILASILQIKPIVILRGGMLDIGDRVRSRQKSFEHILHMIKEQVGTNPVNIAVVHANDPAAGRTLLEKARQAFNCRETFLADLSISVAAHLGPGAIGIVAYTVEE